MTAKSRETFSKLGRIEQWSKFPNQQPFKIVQAFRVLEQIGVVEYEALKRMCTDCTGPYCVGNSNKFANDFRSLETDLARNYGKVFYRNGSAVEMYDQPKAKVEQFFPEPSK